MCATKDKASSMNMPSVLGACRRAIANHLSSILARPCDALLPLVQQTTTQRKPSHSVFTVVIRRLGAGVDEQALQQCIILPLDLQQVIVRARRTKDMLLFDPAPLYLIQCCLERINHDFGGSASSSSETQGLVQSDNKVKRDRDSSESTVFVNGARLQADEDSFTGLRRVVLTGFVARLMMSESHGSFVKVIMEPYQPGTDTALDSEFMRGLDLYSDTPTEQTTEAHDPYLQTVKGALDTSSNGIKAQLKDDMWVVDLSAQKLGHVKVFTTTSSARPPATTTTAANNETVATASMDVPTPIVQTLVSLARHFSETECTRYVWVVPESRRLFVEQVLFLAEAIFPDIHAGRQRSKRTISSLEASETGSTSGTKAAVTEPWTKTVELVYFGPAFGTDTWKALASEGNDRGLSIVEVAKARMRDSVIENRGQPQTTMALGDGTDDDDEDDDFGQEHKPLDEAELSRMAAILSTSALTVASAGGRRLRKLNVDMNRILDGKGNSGVFLQYVLSRLHGIERKSNTRLNPEADLSVLQPYDEALNLALVIAEWHDVISQLHEQHDPYFLVSYLFNLAAEIGHANRVLRVKDMASNVAEARWFLFWAAKRVLEQGLELLGLQSVEHM
ncbi:Arginyl-tRNA synthetase [Mortierella alpina]|nr:Arginyl-tRNA synthetase [Mortierella alpina]